MLNTLCIFLRPLLSPEIKELIMKKKVELRLSHPEHSNMFLCEKCLSWCGEFRREATMISEALWIQVTCLCNSIKCEKCENTRKIPDSCVWTLEDDYFAHVPNFTGIKPCSKCGSKMEKSEY